jgi:DNA-binding MarR family transcriptional regulator
MSRNSKEELIGRLISAYRSNTSQEGAFDSLAAAKLGISPSDLRCLDLVQAHDGMTAGELASASGLTTGAVTAVIDRLESAGFVRRVRDEDDRRKVNVEVTPRHYAEAGKIWKPLMDDWMKTLSGRFTTQELQTIIAFLESATELGERHAKRIAPGS